MKISYSIMAHQKRKEWAEEISKQLDCPIYYDTDNTIWNTCKGAWKLAKKSDYHFVIQDDAILCTDFKNTVQKFIEKSVKENGETAFQLYFGKNREKTTKQYLQSKKAFEKGFVRENNCAWGVAIGLPTKLIDEMIKFGNSYPAWQDDTKIKYYLKSKKIDTIFPIPCFVDHRPIEQNPTITPCVDFDKTSEFFIENSLRDIPKIIHQIWIGDKNKMPKQYMDTWKMDGWEYMLWTEKEIDELGLKNRKLYDYFYNKKCYYGASDVVRLEVINKYGGIYIDADTERLQPIDEIIENCTFVSAFSNTASRVANGVIGAVPEHRIIKEYIKEMGNAKVVEPVWSTIGGTMFTNMITKYQDKYTKLLPARSFYPFDSKGNKNTSRYKNYARHYWGSTHNSYGK